MANYPWASSSVFEYRTPCCECPVDCCYYLGAGSGDGGSATGTLPTSTTANLSVTTTNSTETLALGLAGTIALIFSSAAEVTLTFTSEGIICGATITGLTPDSEGEGTATYTIPSDGCYVIALTSDSGPGMWTTMTASVAISSTTDILCDTLDDQGFTPSSGGGGP